VAGERSYRLPKQPKRRISSKRHSWFRLADSPLAAFFLVMSESAPNVKLFFLSVMKKNLPSFDR
jgi:hypothetical protein